jgi:glycosyltransferase involved in cell wall biosynthesis
MRPRVALVVTTTATDPGELVAARLHHLLESGWDARLLCKGERWASDPALADPRLQRKLELAPARSPNRLPRPLLRRPAGLVRYLGARGEAGPFDGRLLDLRPDLVHFHSGWAAWKGMRLKWFLGCRLVISFREDGRDLDVPDPGVLWEGADLLIFPSPAALERGVARGCPRETAEVLPPPPLGVNSAPAPHNDSTGFLRILSAGSLIWEQGYEHSVHAVRLLLDMGIGCEYRIVGDGDHFPAVAFARHQLDLKDHVRLLRPDGTDRLVEETLAADVVVDPAVTDTVSPVTLATAQALGVPFIATRRAGLAEDAGIAVPRRNPRAIADGLAVFARDSALRKRMGQAGRRGIGRYPTLEDHLAQLESIYCRALGPRFRRRGSESHRPPPRPRSSAPPSLGPAPGDRDNREASGARSSRGS